MLEDLMKELIAELRENTAALKEASAIRGKALEKAEALTVGKASPAKAEEAPEKPAKPAAEKPASKPAKPAADKPARRAKTVTFDQLKAKFASYLDPHEIEDEDEYEAEKDARTEKVLAIFEEFGAAKITQLKDEDYPRAMKLIEEMIEKGYVNFAADQDGEEDEEDDPLG